MFLILGLYLIILAYRGISVVYGRIWGNNIPQEPWQMYGVGIICLMFSACILCFSLKDMFFNKTFNNKTKV